MQAKAFRKSMKFIITGLCHAVTFSMICLSTEYCWGSAALGRVLRVADGGSPSRGDSEGLCRILQNKAPWTNSTGADGARSAFSGISI